MSEEAALFINHYHCADCNETWISEWSSTCNDKCPQCNKEIEPENSDDTPLAKRLEELRVILHQGNISYDELHELQSMASLIPKDDVELLEAAGVPEFPEEEKPLFTESQAVEAITARRDGEFDNPQLLKLGALTNLEDDIKRIQQLTK